MKKWNVTLSTTDPDNYVGIINVRQGNVNSEVMEAQIVQNGLPLDLTDCTATFQAFLGGEHVVERSCKIIDYKKGIVQYTFDEYTLQSLHRQKANIAFYKGEEEIATTQDFTYFVIHAVSKTPGEMGSYWQTAEDLINDMKDYLNAGKGDFEDWFNSIKDILESIDPGGKLLSEVLDLKKIVYRKVPSGFNVVIEHDSEYQPDVKVTYYKNSIGTEANGFDSGPVFGGERIYNLASSLSYIRNKVNVELPSVYTMDGEVVNNGNELLLINGTEVIRFVIDGATITKGYVEKVKTPTNLTVSDVTSSSAKFSWENG
ncbi:BppU family phage baseplate upper protein [Lactococcus petauri]|uniref:BppU family phage baseplate upper protein n=1 Tax=Lactococcus petauri TaxID=1940789 RepID=A0AAJ2IXW6_9LACT|nr:BppU family phage baseplate upper protein [Lactococcus petauri]MDT2526373.1 BppU family phage baseplate upper protein [Lactococcus petauri]MDT2540918.1 BppU family phage baseplate upper protein [Lactococcus petauri]MDT2557492.1 BppU family phage baseplate upper protein [Lactococcus petauri]MDT2559433.1 BppU family phage baseplate upper protein [Lactococcus petauri]MDT2568006.1 BppU family phage baseplate upper protein [Lactococcus petauri]